MHISRNRHSVIIPLAEFYKGTLLRDFKYANALVITRHCDRILLIRGDD